MNTTAWTDAVSPIGDIWQLLVDGYDVEIDSPDGFVPVTAFVDKGEWDEYVLTTTTGKQVRCNERHLFEVCHPNGERGWKFAGDMVGKPCFVHTTDGDVLAHVRRTGQRIPIVDVQVDHSNHRYYADGVSSHNTNVGKSLFLCHVAASTISLGKHVAYLTMEMSEEKIAERIDANLLDVTLNDLQEMPRRMYEKSMASLKARQAYGKLIIKEYPTGGANVGHFRSLLDELALKKGFVPDLLIIDYVNICASVRLKQTGQINSYNYVKSIAEELRGLAVEYNVPVLTATQFNREGYDSSDPSLTNTSESFGLPQTADLQVALVTSEELEQEGLLMVKQLKNRYADTSKYRRFTITVDRAKMQLGNCKTQDYLSDPMPKAKQITKPSMPNADDEMYAPRLNKGGKRPDWMKHEIIL